MKSQESKPNLPKKVVVSGCFDLLHSGHVKFFEEAAKYGDLYVCLGTDANIETLKNHKTTFSNKERLYMIRAIKYVHEARLSSGDGDIDFEPDLDDIKPDIFFVNEDGDREAKRIVIKKRGIQYIVAKREPSKGLKARSSTQIKSDLKNKNNKQLILAQRNNSKMVPLLYGINGIWHFLAAFYFIFKSRGIIGTMSYYPFKKGNEIQTQYMLDMIRFLGLLNTTFVALAIICLLRYYYKSKDDDNNRDKRWEYMLLFGIANMSQFIGDLKIIMDRKTKTKFLYTITAGDGLLGFIDLYVAMLLYKAIKQC